MPAEDSSSITIGVITAAESSMVSCIVGDVCGTIQLCQLDMAQTSENVAIFPVIPSESNNFMEIAEFLTDKMSLSPAAVCGIIANIIYESNGLPNILGDNGTHTESANGTRRDGRTSSITVMPQAWIGKRLRGSSCSFGMNWTTVLLI